MGYTNGAIPSGSIAARAGLALAVLFSFASGVVASETRLILKSDGFGDGYYYTLDNPVGQNSRYITEYLPGDTDPLSLITRARVALVNTGSADPGDVLIADLRTEDPNHPGYPLLTEDGLIATADPNQVSTCDASSRWTEFFVFGGGAGIPAPLGKFYLTIMAPPGQSGVDACGVEMDTSSPPLGSAKFYLSNFDFFGMSTWNHLAEIEVREEGDFDLRTHWRGSSRYAGDQGRPVFFARRPSIEGPTDDFITVAVTIDNERPTKAFREIHFYADRSQLGFTQRMGFKEFTSMLRVIGSSQGLPEVLPLRSGRTSFLLEIPVPLPERIVSRFPANVRFRAEIVDPNTENVSDFEEGVLGLRPAPGAMDDGSGEGLFLVQSPTYTNDALAVRFPAIDLPTTETYSVSAIQLEGGELGGESLDGFDAVEIRLEDPILVDAPDLSPAGLLRRVGEMDGIGEIPMGQVMTELTLDVTDIRVDPVFEPLGNLWAQVLLNPGDTNIPQFGTFLGGDGTGQTLLADSFYTMEGRAQYVRDLTQNYQIRLLLDGRLGPEDPDGTRTTSTDLRLPPGGFTTTQDGILINLEQYLSNGGEPGQ